MKVEFKKYTNSAQEREIASHYYQRDLDKWYAKEFDDGTEPPTEPKFKWEWADGYIARSLVSGPLYIIDGDIQVFINGELWLLKYSEETFNKLIELIDNYIPV